MTIDGDVREALHLDPAMRAGIARELLNSLESQTG